MLKRDWVGAGIEVDVLVGLEAWIKCERLEHLLWGLQGNASKNVSSIVSLFCKENKYLLIKD